MTTKFESLYEFIDRAVKNRKYPTSTSHGLKAALRLFEAELNDDERVSLDKVKENIDQIYHSVSVKNKNMAASSLASYKVRLAKVIRDFEKYGIDPTKMNNWSVKPVLRQGVRPRKQSTEAETEVDAPPVVPKSEFETTANFVFDFKGGIKLVIPRNQSTSDAIADGELKTARQALTAFADSFVKEDVTPTPVAQDDVE